MPGSGRYNKEPLPEWAALLFGLLFVALGGFFVFAPLVGEREPGAPIIALLIAGAIAVGLMAFGIFVVSSVLKHARRR